MKSFEFALKELKEATGAQTSLNKPVALLREILELVQDKESKTEENTEGE